MDILVIVEDNHGAMHRLSKEAIAGAQTISEDISVLVIGENSKKISTELEAYDLSEIITVEHDLVLSYNADGYTEVVSKVVLGFCRFSDENSDFNSLTFKNVSSPGFFEGLERFGRLVGAIFTYFHQKPCQWRPSYDQKKGCRVKNDDP